MASGSDVRLVPEREERKAFERDNVVIRSYSRELHRWMWDIVMSCRSSGVFWVEGCGKMTRSFVGYMQVFLDKIAT